MKKQIIVLMGALALGSAVASALDVVENFSTDPLQAGSGWTFGIGDNTSGQFSWTPAGGLNVHADSSLPTVRLDLPIGTTLTGASDFTLTARFNFTVTSAPGDQFMQFAFGLVNDPVTGGNRTGGFTSSSDTFDTVEVNYFPNVSPDFGGPTLTPVAIGPQVGGNDTFGNFASVFGSDSLLTGDPLPSATELQATLSFSSVNQTMILTLQQVNTDQSLTLLHIVTLRPSSPGAQLLDPTFSVNSLALMSYNDGFTGSEDPSLVGDITFQKLEIVPEPSSIGFLSLGAAGVFAWWKRRRR